MLDVVAHLPRSGCWLSVALAGGVPVCACEGEFLPRAWYQHDQPPSSLHTSTGDTIPPPHLGLQVPPRVPLYLQLCWDFSSSKHCNILNLFPDANLSFRHIFPSIFARGILFPFMAAEAIQNLARSNYLSSLKHSL